MSDILITIWSIPCILILPKEIAVINEIRQVLGLFSNPVIKNSFLQKAGFLMGCKVKSKKPSKTKYVKIIPVQIDRHHLDKYGNIRVMIRRSKPHLGRYFRKGLTVDKLKDALVSSNARPRYSIKQDQNFIKYQYRGKPPIALNTKDCQFYSTKSSIDRYGIDAVQYQAYIVAKSEIASSTILSTSSLFLMWIE